MGGVSSLCGKCKVFEGSETWKPNVTEICTTRKTTENVLIREYHKFKWKLLSWNDESDTYMISSL